MTKLVPKLVFVLGMSTPATAVFAAAMGPSCFNYLQPTQQQLETLSEGGKEILAAKEILSESQIHAAPHLAQYSLGEITTHIDAGQRFSITRAAFKEALSESPVAIPLQESTSTKFGPQKNFNPVLESLGAETQNFYALNTPMLIGYARSLVQTPQRLGGTVQFVFWEGRKSNRIDTHTVIKGTLTQIKHVLGKDEATNPIEKLDHYVLSINELPGIDAPTVVKIPSFLTDAKVRSVSLPQESVSGYHWGMLLGVPTSEK